MLKLYAWIQSQKGATAIEYALVASGISLAIISLAFTLGDEVEALFSDVVDEMQAN